MGQFKSQIPHLCQSQVSLLTNKELPDKDKQEHRLLVKEASVSKQLRAKT